MFEEKKATEESKKLQPVEPPRPAPKAESTKKMPEEKKMAAEETSEKERRDLKEVDEKLSKLTAGIKVDKKPQLAPLAPLTKEKEKLKPAAGTAGEEKYDQDHFEYNARLYSVGRSRRTSWIPTRSR